MIGTVSLRLYLSFLVIWGLPLISTARPLAHNLKHWEHDAGPHAQCMTRISPTDRLELDQGVQKIRSQGPILQDREEHQVDSPEHFSFNVAFHVIYTNETAAGGFVNDSRIEAQMKVLNEDYRKAGISFVLVNTTRTHNPDWFNGSYPGSEQEQTMKRTYRNGDATTLNVYTLTFNSTTKSLGTSSIPSAYFRDPVSDGILIRHSTITVGSRKNFNLGRTLTHEVGHWLGLFHIFQGGCNHGVGDNIADTPPSASGSEGCPVGRDSCPGDGPDLINNFMDYSFDSCMDSFTPGQIRRMHESILAFRRPGSATDPDVGKQVPLSQEKAAD